MKRSLRINTKIIKALKPCEERLEPWIKEHWSFDGDVTEFFKLDIPNYDKLWVVLRLVSPDIRVTFALDCAFSAYAYSASDAYAYASAADSAAASAAVYAAYADADSADAAKLKEKQNQLAVLLYLIKGEW